MSESDYYAKYKHYMVLEHLKDVRDYMAREVRAECDEYTGGDTVAMLLDGKKIVLDDDGEEPECVVIYRETDRLIGVITEETRHPGSLEADSMEDFAKEEQDIEAHERDLHAKGKCGGANACWLCSRDEPEEEEHP